MSYRIVLLMALGITAGCAEPASIVRPEAPPEASLALAAQSAQPAAQILSGTESINGANALGGLAGRIGSPGAFYYKPGSLTPFGTPGRAFDLSEDGQVVVGFTGTCCDGGFVWTNSGGGWQYTVLPKSAGAAYHAARGVGSDAGGAAVYVGGLEGYGNAPNYIRQPRLWAAGSWTEYALPAPASTDSPLFDVNAAGAATGSVGGRASAWVPNGFGGWDLVYLGASGSQGWAINQAGDIVVGFAGSAAQYWTRSGSVWTAHALPGGCTEAVDIDDTGRILANGCANGKAKTPALISAPYGSANVQLLAGVGTSGTTATAHRMAANGAWVAGEAPSKGATVGVYWHP